MTKQVFDKVLQLYLSDVAKDNRFEGVLVAGSYASGELGPYSDLDIYLLLAGDAGNLAGWETREIESVELEITQNTFEGYRAVLRKAKDIRQVIVPLAEGHILLDRNSQFAEIKEQAQGVVHDLSLPVPPDDQTKMSIMRPLTFGYRKIGNAYMCQKWDAFELEYGFVLHLLPTQVLALSGRCITPHPLKLLREEHPDIYNLLTKCFNSKTHDEKWNAYCMVIDRVFTRFSLGKLPRPI